MVAINFTKFIDKVEARTKRRTIRKTARGCTGQSVQLYTGMRTKACRKLVSADPVLIRVEPVAIDDILFWHRNEHGHWNWDGSKLTKKFGSPDAARLAFAQADGFESWAEMVAFFKSTYNPDYDGYGRMFEGYLHEWAWPDETGHVTAEGCRCAKHFAEMQAIEASDNGDLFP